MLEIAQRRVHIDTSLNGCSDYSELTIHKHKITDHNYFTFIQHWFGQLIFFSGHPLVFVKQFVLKYYSISLSETSEAKNLRIFVFSGTIQISSSLQITPVCLLTNLGTSCLLLYHRKNKQSKHFCGLFWSLGITNPYCFLC